jgi:hypothetical protein
LLVVPGFLAKVSAKMTWDFTVDLLIFRSSLYLKAALIGIDGAIRNTRQAVKLSRARGDT